MQSRRLVLPSAAAIWLGTTFSAGADHNSVWGEGSAKTSTIAATIRRIAAIGRRFVI